MPGKMMGSLRGSGFLSFIEKFGRSLLALSLNSDVSILAFFNEVPMRIGHWREPSCTGNLTPAFPQVKW
jgi:hypothetical protein